MMVVRKKSIRIVWRDGFFLYLCAVVLYANGIFVFRYDKDGDISDGDDMRR